VHIWRQNWRHCKIVHRWRCVVSKIISNVMKHCCFIREAFPWFDFIQCGWYALSYVLVQVTVNSPLEPWTKTQTCTHTRVHVNVAWGGRKGEKQREVCRERLLLTFTLLITRAHSFPRKIFGKFCGWTSCRIPSLTVAKSSKFRGLSRSFVTYE